MPLQPGQRRDVGQESRGQPGRVPGGLRDDLLALVGGQVRQRVQEHPQFLGGREGLEPAPGPGVAVLAEPRDGEGDGAEPVRDLLCLRRGREPLAPPVQDDAGQHVDALREVQRPHRRQQLVIAAEIGERQLVRRPERPPEQLPADPALADEIGGAVHVRAGGRG